MRLAACFFVITTSVLEAQGTKTREDVTRYSAHAELRSLAVGANFWGHYVPIDGTSLKTNSYLVVEVALFAPPSAKLMIKPSEFLLRVNGHALEPQPASLVTIGMIVPEMRERGPRVEAVGGVGPVIVSAGRDPVQPKFPGDNNPADIPLPPRSESPDKPLRKEPLDPVKAVNDAALPEGSHAAPISGYLFYAWPGKLKAIKHAEIEYKSLKGVATLTLR
jgi:hypothetical protein